jgi:hypothetical protein
MKNFINKYGKYIIILLLGLLLGLVSIFVYEKVKEGFVNGDFGNIAKEITFANTDKKRLTSVLKPAESSNNKYIIDFGGYINIIGFKIDLLDEYANDIIQYRLKVENDILNEYINSGEEIVFVSGNYYDIRDNNYNVNQLTILVDSTIDVNILDKIGSIKIYGIKQFDKLVSDDITIVKNLDTQTFNIQFNKLLDVDNIEYYFILIAKYDNNKEFLSKQIIRLNNNKINFYGQLAKLIPSSYIDFEKSTNMNTNLSTNEFDGILKLTDLVGTITTTSTLANTTTSTLANTTTTTNPADTTTTNPIATIGQSTEGTVNTNQTTTNTADTSVKAPTSTEPFNNTLNNNTLAINANDGSNKDVNSLNKNTNVLKISDTTSLSDAARILEKYDTASLIDVFKLILKNRYLENDKDTRLLLEEINDYSSMKFLNNGIGDDKDTFIRKWGQNYYYYQSDEVKVLLKYVYDLIENYADACNEFSCLVSSPKLDITDTFDNPYYYKVGVGYIRLDVLGNEIYSPITSYRNEGEVLFTMKEDVIKLNEENELTTGDNLYNKLKMVNNVDIKKIRGIIGSNYPNNFSISTQNLKDYVDVDEYKDNKYSPIQFDINIFDKVDNS